MKRERSGVTCDIREAGSDDTHEVVSGLCCIIWDVKEEWSEGIDHETYVFISVISLDGSELFVSCHKGCGSVFSLHGLNRRLEGMLPTLEWVKNR